MGPETRVRPRGSSQMAAALLLLLALLRRPWAPLGSLSQRDEGCALSGRTEPGFEVPGDKAPGHCSPPLPPGNLSTLPPQWPAHLVPTSAESPASVCHVHRGPTRMGTANSAARHAPAAMGSAWLVPATYPSVEASAGPPWREEGLGVAVGGSSGNFCLY